jgi:3-keto-disaccharide hydrolase
MTRSCCLVVLSLAIAAVASAADDPPGYRPLFDGQSLAGWEGAGQPAEKCWKVEAGTIVCTGEKGPWLRSREQFDDFNLRLEYKLKPDGNSGVYIRVPENGNHHGDGAGIEVQVLDDKAERYKEIKPYQFTGSLYAIAPATSHVGKDAGEWNTLEINCHGTKYHVVHNGTTIIATDEAAFPELKGRLTKGHLGLQNHSEEVWYRNLRIGPARDLPVQPAPGKLDVGRIRELLSKPILEASTPQREVEAFCEARVVRFPAEDAAQRKSPEAWKKYTDELRQRVLDAVVYRGEAAKWRDATCKVEWLETIDGGEGYKIKKLRLEALPGLWVPALLYEPTKLDGKAPVFLNVNGHDGKGKAADYKQIRCINQAKRGIISLNLEWFGMGQLRTPGFTHYKLNQLDLCGTSGVGPFFLAMKRGLDVLLAHPNADATRVGVAGLSGGGWQTIVFSSLDTRVTLANPVAGYSSYLTRIQYYSDLGDSEQTPCDLAATADYAHLTAMLAPRVALLTYNEKDNCCFAAPRALPPLLAAARPIYQLLGAGDALHEHINYDPGTHNFERDNREAHYKVIGQHWFSGESGYSSTEIESEKEVKTAEELAVELPADNLDLQQLAQHLMQTLPRTPTPPKTAGGAAAWQRAEREAVARVLRIGKHQRLPVAYEVSAGEFSRQTWGDVQITSWKLKIGDTWTIPALEFAPPAAKSSAIVLADGGRPGTAEQIEKLVAEDCQVIAVDPFYFGESKIKNKDFLFALFVSSAGERPLGIQASQIGAIARWLSTDRRLPEAKLIAVGPRTSLIALAAAAIETKAIAAVELHESRGSLKEIIEQGGAVNTAPEPFCFGLLGVADIRELAMLVAPREVHFRSPSDRAKTELAGLKSWYGTAGKSFNPLAP